MTKSSTPELGKDHFGASTVLQIDDLCHSYPQRPLFSNLTASVSSGVSLLRGGDGSGKTTLIRLLAGALEPQAGNLSINGAQLSREPKRYREQLFWADHAADAFEQICALQYFELQRASYPNFLEQDAPFLLELIAGLGLQPHIAKPMYMLSTGTKRKVWLTAAFSAQAAVILLDDPFAALDQGSVRFVIDQLKRAARHRTQAIIVSHYEDLADVPLARIIDLDEPG